MAHHITSKFSVNEKDTFNYIMWNFLLNLHDEKEDTRRGILQFYKGFCKPKWFVCTLRTYFVEQVTTQAYSSLPNQRASLSRSLATDLSVDSQIFKPNLKIAILSIEPDQHGHHPSDNILKRNFLN